MLRVANSYRTCSSSFVASWVENVFTSKDADFVIFFHVPARNRDGRKADWLRCDVALAASQRDTLVLSKHINNRPTPNIQQFERSKSCGCSLWWDILGWSWDFASWSWPLVSSSPRPPERVLPRTRPTLTLCEQLLASTTCPNLLKSIPSLRRSSLSEKSTWLL